MACFCGVSAVGSLQVWAASPVEREERNPKEKRVELELWEEKKKL